MILRCYIELGEWVYLNSPYYNFIRMFFFVQGYLRRYREGYKSGYLLPGGTWRDRSLDIYCQEVQGGIEVWIPIARRYREG